MKYLPTPEIERRARTVLLKTGSMRIPVPVEAVAHRLGLRVERASLGEEVSGVLVIGDDGGVIGVNQAHSPVRQRFSVAHEIGHFVLHPASSQIFIDRQYSTVFRDSRSSAGEDRAEIQANQFAAALLMPDELLRDEIGRREFDLADESVLEDLAQTFRVSRQAMAFRLSDFGFLKK